MKQPNILLVTTESDLTADYVVTALTSSRAKFFRLNTDYFPLQDFSSFFNFRTDRSFSWEWVTSQSEISLSNIKAVWYRRHRLPDFPVNLDEGVVDFCARESLWFLRGALLSLDHAKWMNHPSTVFTAESKLLQLRSAQRLWPQTQCLGRWHREWALPQSRPKPM